MSERPDIGDVRAPIEDTEVSFGLKVGVVGLFLLIVLLVLALIALAGGTTVF